ncbi:MAG TPA: helix-turn-helix domain-containing protein [Deltaproteobacteria bacterium]|nr:helix-turn-helix domain-containing protein [Deltaproteobacteria bacterium]HOI08405.1 helix-turn-helix domain-containing protein [Deltaproteobacteria bacterium]
MRCRNRHRSRVVEAVHETARDLYELGLINKRTLQSYDALCIEPVPDYKTEQIRELRNRYQLSQSVFASLLNISLSTVQKWEIGEKHPGGPSLEPLSILDRKGIEALM